MAVRERSGGRRGGGRQSRIAARTAPEIEINPCPPGQKGGAYRPLSDHDVDQVVTTAFRILNEIGMGEAPGILIETAVAGGATVNEFGRLCFPRALVDEIVGIEFLVYQHRLAP